jgi:hypothetical protein
MDVFPAFPVPVCSILLSFQLAAANHRDFHCGRCEKLTADIASVHQSILPSLVTHGATIGASASAWR